MKTILNSSAAIFSLLWSVAIWNKSVSGPAGFWELQNCCLRVSQFCTPPWQYFIRGLTQLKYFGFKWSRKTCSRCAVKSGRVLGVHSWRMRFLCVCVVSCVFWSRSLYDFIRLWPKLPASDPRPKGCICYTVIIWSYKWTQTSAFTANGK